jgi:3-dehydroquinate synthase
MSVQRFSIKAPGIHSEIVVGAPLGGLLEGLKPLAAPGAKVAVFSDAAVAGSYGKSVAQALESGGFQVTRLVVPSGERSKTLSQAGRLYSALAKAGFERQSWLIAVGGGVVGDLTGFVAATFLRGLPFVQVPTTLLAQVDAAIGGKTAVDIPLGKNLVGSFYHPRLVWIDPQTLKSLPKAHWRNGMAEVIKYGAIADRALFEQLEKQMESLMKGYSPAWIPIIARCAQIKAEIVSKDPFEKNGLRATLNFGHSVGHAIEAATGYDAYLHGEAISIGMFVAGFLSAQYELIEPVDRIRLGTLLTKAGLPSRVKRPIPREKLMAFLARDKKAEQGEVKFVLLKDLGEAVSGQSIDLEVLDPALSFSGL